MKKFLPMFLLTMLLGMFAVGCGSAPPPSPKPESPDHEADAAAAAEHSPAVEHDAQ